MSNRNQRFKQAVHYHQQQCPAWRDMTKSLDLSQFDTLANLAKLPIIAKDELPERQQHHPPYGNVRCFGATGAFRLYRSPGPIYEFETACENFWQINLAMQAAGFSDQDIIANTFSYHYTPAGMMFDEGAANVGCQIFAAGPGNTEQLLESIEHLQITAYTGTPDFLKIIIDKAQQTGANIQSLNKALVSGGYLSPAIKQQCQAAGISVKQCYATADVGLIAYEQSTEDGLLCADHIVVEIINPQTLQPLAYGEVGEVVVSRLCVDAPMLRFATGDLSKIISSSNDKHQRIQGWLGRSDASVKVRGQFIRPVQLQTIIKAFPAINSAQLQISNDHQLDQLLLQVNLSTTSTMQSIKQSSEELLTEIQQRFKQITALNATIQLSDEPFDTLILDKRKIEVSD